MLKELLVIYNVKFILSERIRIQDVPIGIRGEVKRRINNLK